MPASAETKLLKRMMGTFMVYAGPCRPMTAGRGRAKISAEAAAAAVIAAMDARRPRAWIGHARLLPPLLRLAPTLAQSILQRT